MTQTPPPSAGKLPPRRGRWETWLLVAVVFVAGIACGAGVTIAVAVHRVRYVLQHPEAARARLVLHLERRLDLKGDQAQRVRDIVERRQQAWQEIRREVQPRVESQLEGLRSDVSETLDTTQRAKWERMYQEVRRNWLPPMASKP